MENDASAKLSGAEEYRQLAAYAQSRRDSLTGLFGPVLEVTAGYGALIADIVAVLGTIPPKSQQDEVVRDLLADVFDFLYEWERPLMEGRSNVAFPLARRAYESMSLLSVCLQDEKLAKRWSAGRQIGNEEVRRALSKLAMGESEDRLRSLYAFFSEGAHPNRTLVANRHLGAGNEFVLGSIGVPNLPMAALHCIHLVEMWFWFVATSGYYAKEALRDQRPGFGAEYFAVVANAKEVTAWLNDEYNRLVSEEAKK